MSRLEAAIRVSEVALLAVHSEEERLSVLQAMAVLFADLDPVRAKAAYDTAVVLLETEEARARATDAQESFRTLLREAAMPDEPNPPRHEDRHDGDGNGERH